MNPRRDAWNWADRSSEWGFLASIPTGLRPLAQGCEARATLGNRAQRPSNPNGVVPLQPVASVAVTPSELGVREHLAIHSRPKPNGPPFLSPAQSGWVPRPRRFSTPTGGDTGQTQTQTHFSSKAADLLNLSNSPQTVLPDLVAADVRRLTSIPRNVSASLNLTTSRFCALSSHFEAFCYKDFSQCLRGFIPCLPSLPWLNRLPPPFSKSMFPHPWFNFFLKN